MAIEDYFDPYYDEYDAVVSCKFCGKTPLYWVPAPNGAWRLVDAGDRMDRGGTRRATRNFAGARVRGRVPTPIRLPADRTLACRRSDDSPDR